MEEQNNQKRTLGKVLTGIGYAVCVFLAMIFIINVTMIVKSYIYPDKVPDFMGYKPFIVLSGSMEPEILAGDLIVTKEIIPENLQVGDVISFRVEEDIVVSHRVTEIQNEGGLSFLTKGDANTGMDATEVLPESIEGLYIWRGAGLGRFALFLQTPIGMLIFVVTPLCLFIIYDIVSRNRRSKKKSDREAELEAELAALKAAKEENTGTGDSEQKTLMQ
ncbi:MAG: signal peptidase I [Bacillota bacterium]|jgi:signal peptidase